MSAKKREFEPGHGFNKEDWDEVSNNPKLPELAASIKRTRGRQKTPTKELISLRVDRDTLAAFRATGPGWQSRINKALREAAPHGGQKKHG